MNADQLANTSRRGGARIGRGLDRTDVASDDSGDETGINLLPTDEHHVRCLHHRVSGFDHADQAAGFDHTD